MQLCFFEDKKCANLYPLTLSRPVDDLRTGILTTAKKWCLELKSTSYSRITNPHLTNVFASAAPNKSENCIWLNSRYLPDNTLLEKIHNLDEGTCIQNGSTVIAAHVNGALSLEWINAGQPRFNSLMVLEAPAFKCIENLWDLFLMNGDEIRADVKRLNYPGSDNNFTSEAIFKNRDQIFIDDGAVIEPGAILMADKGPIYVGKGATVMAGALIKGPAAICENATIKMGAKIYPDTTIGPVCKVGGEVHNSIFHSYSNKGHDGFVGNSLIGQWCNLGADTNTSNLKNNYSTIRITDWQSGEQIETGQQFFGTVMGDHTKTAINTQLNTGTVCGVSCNIFAGDFPPKFIPSFSWVGSNVIQPYKLDKAYEAMDAMMARRKVELTEDYKALIGHLFKAEHK
jgi:UDP-N-acetylglucosamine diphosphorylase/glucosamine-1-phosphate N-acetyltransferase